MTISGYVPPSGEQRTEVLARSIRAAMANGASQTDLDTIVAGAVRHDIAQSLSSTAEQQARTNISVAESLTANRTYYVRSDGSDSNDGLTNSAAGAKLTFSGAIAAAKVVNPNGYTITIKAGEASGTWTTPILVSEGTFVYGGYYVFEGDTTTPSNHTISISSASNACIDIKNTTAIITAKGFKVTSSHSGTSGIYAQNNAKVYHSNIEFGALTGSGVHIAAVSGAKIYCSSDYTISGDASYHVYVDDNSYVALGTSNTITISGTRTMTAFVYAHGPGVLHGSQVSSVTLAGGASFTGLKAKADLGGLVDAGSVTFPGSGSSISSGIFNESTIKTWLPSGTHTAALATFQSTATAAGTSILSISDNSRDSAIFYANGDGTGYNAANAVMKIRQASATGRSINAAGTLNASGADYAEYEFKNAVCGNVAKGDIVGFDADGLLTDKFSKAVSFGIKSTSPNIVGGDVWGLPDCICPLDGKPIGEPPEIEDAPEPFDDDMAQSDAFKLLLSEWLARKQRWEVDFAAWSERFESARSRVDRIAYAGKVPVNMSGAVVGRYVNAVSGPFDSIVAACSATRDETTVGRVMSIGDDGRPVVRVVS